METNLKMHRSALLRASGKAAAGCVLAGLMAAAQAATPAIPPVPAGKITNMAIGSDNVLDGQKLDITISGEGKACNYYLTLTNTDTQQEWPLPKISAFPAQDRIQMDLPNPNYPHGNYKFTAKARPNDTRPGTSCQGGGNYITFKKTRPAIKLAADTPKIVDVLIEPGKKMGGTDRYRNDEVIKFNVVGSVENSSPQDSANRCGWTAQLIDKNGVAKDIAKDARFGVWQPSASFAGLATGDYMLTVKTTAADDGLAKQPCLGKAAKKVEIFSVPGVIKGFGVQSWGSPGGIGASYAEVIITPKIDGPTCMYRVIRKIDHGKGTKTTIHTHVAGVADKVPQEEYPHDETFLDITIEGISNNYFEGGSCEGTANKSLTVYDDPGKPPINK